MSISDWINAALAAMSFILALVSIKIAIDTLRQNREMIENATRPYLSIYGAVTNFQGPQYYLVLRNFGQSAALITKFTSSVDLAVCSESKDGVPFEHIVGFTLAPNQAIQVPVDYSKLVQTTQELTITIDYLFGKKRYSETVVINLSAHADYPITRASTNGAELKIISYTLQDIATRTL